MHPLYLENTENNSKIGTKRVSTLNIITSEIFTLSLKIAGGLAHSQA
jgi:hypothetical protein